MAQKDWLAYGQSAMPALGAIDNPTVAQGLNLNGIVGESTLPFVVPEGKQLVLTGWGYEGLPTPAGVCIPWIGELPCTNAKCLASVGCGGSQYSYYVTNMRWVLPAGKKLNVRLLNGTTGANIVCAWMIQGYLEDVI